LTTETERARPILSLAGIGKRFPGVTALAEVDLDLYAGEVHMLLGENGAGKSTLMKVLYGSCRADTGRILHAGQPVTIGSPRDARALGIAVIFQELSLVPYLNVAQNIFLGREPVTRLLRRVDHKAMHRAAGALLERMGVSIDTRTKAHALSVAQQQVVEIAKALSQDARILVMDEPTAPLSNRECENLFRIVDQLRAEGVAIVYISHRLDEVFRLGDRITVLRDGRRVAALKPAETTAEALVQLMVGRKVEVLFPRRRTRPPGPAVLELENIAAASGIHDVTLTVRRGEIVGLTGLVGAGRSEVARAVFGADPTSHGRILLDGRPLAGTTAQRARRGLALIPEDRKEQGLALSLPVEANLLMASLSRLFPQGWFQPATAERVSTDLIARLRIATPSAQQAVKLLSGGNQQKVVLGKWLPPNSRVFIFDEPTRGIDVGAKAEIFSLIDGLVEEGAAVLMISSELSEIVHMCDRAYVMRAGTVIAELSHDQLSEAAILAAAMGEAA
jgi:ribose transport system ATP-binding protein